MIWRLAQGEMHIPPAAAEDMTLGEIEVCLDDDTAARRGPEGFVPMGPAEMAEHARRRREMSAAERLRAARGR